MNMITRVARAILKIRYYEPEFYTDEESFCLDCDPDLVMEAEAEARAAFETIRESDDETLERAARAMFDIRPVGDEDSENGISWEALGPGWRDVYRLMARAAIDAALASPPTPADVNGERT